MATTIEAEPVDASVSKKAGLSASELEQLVLDLFDIGAVKFGSFVLKSGITSPVYVDLRLTVSHPRLLARISAAMFALIAHLPMAVLCGVPYTALPFATCMSVANEVAMVFTRKEKKHYGTKQSVEGVFEAGDDCVIVEDLITSGTSILETERKLNEAGLKVAHAVVLIDRQQGGKANTKKAGIECHSVLDIETVLATVVANGRVTDAALIASVRAFLDGHRKVELAVKRRLTFAERAELAKNSVAKRLLQTASRKKTCLCVSADVTECASVLALADAVGPFICALKTHADIVSDFTIEFTLALKALAAKHDFVIFEDRKFADIGSTVMRQFAAGVHRIADWADITNCHSVPGKGVIEGLRRASEESRATHGLLLLAQMSSADNLADLPGYTARTLAFADEYPEFVMGFIATRALCTDKPWLLCLTPGVNLERDGDDIGQRYRSPAQVIGDGGSDIIIVGRGIYESEDVVAEAKRYRDAAWAAYQDAVGADE